MPYLDAGGAGPWIMCGRRNLRREVPQTTPIPGFGCFIGRAGSNNVLLSTPVEHLLRKGISIADYMAFIQRGDGINFLMEHGQISWLKAGEVLWIPYGWLTFWIHYNPFVDKKAHGHAFAVHVPVFKKELFNALPEPVRRGLKEYLQVVTAAENTRGWPERHSFVHETFLS